jgi:DNA invertase Pin-like site-specific DNA recombinase
MTIIGYARVSTTDQNLEIQETILKQRAAHGLGPSKIAKALGIGRASVYRMLEQTP